MLPIRWQSLFSSKRASSKPARERRERPKPASLTFESLESRQLFAAAGLGPSVGYDSIIDTYHKVLNSDGAADSQLVDAEMVSLGTVPTPFTPVPPVPPPPPNARPIAYAGVDQTLKLSNSTWLAGAWSDDGLPNHHVQASWSKVSGPGNVTFADASSATTTASFSQKGTYVLRLTAADGELVGDDSVTIKVKSTSMPYTPVPPSPPSPPIPPAPPAPPPPNTRPTAYAGVDQTLKYSNLTLLSGAWADDGFPNQQVQTTWSVVSGPGNVTFANASNATTTASFSQKGTYVLRLTANDGQLVGTDDVKIKVKSTSTTIVPPSPPAPPVPPAPPMTYSKLFQNGVYPGSSYAGTTDTYFRSDDPTATFGNSTTLRVDGSPDAAAMLRWDLAGIPAGSVIQSVVMGLNVTDPSIDTYELYELKRDWSENDADWNTYDTGQSWGAPGATDTSDRATTALGQLLVYSSGYSPIVLNSSGIAVVQNWLDDPSSNFGFIIEDYNYTSGDALAFSSSEYATVSLRPLLSITYTLPSS